MQKTNIFVTPKEMGNFESFEELFDHFPHMLSGYQPAFYAESFKEKRERQQAKKKGEISVIEDEVQRDKFLVKMMYILMVKRLESSWFSFQSTVGKILNHHQNALDRIRAYEENKENVELNDDIDVFGEDDLKDEIEEFTLGKKRKIRLSDIDEDKIGAMAAAMASLGERVSEELEQGNSQQVLVRGSEGYLLLVRAGEEAVLATLAGKNAKLGLIFLDVKRAAKELEKII